MDKKLVEVDYLKRQFENYGSQVLEDKYAKKAEAYVKPPAGIPASDLEENYVTETELNSKGYLTEHQDISGKVDKEEGKSLIADSEITRLSTVKNYDDSGVKEDIATIKTDYATKTYVGEQIAAADHLKREIVTEIPTAETAAENVIYMLKVESTVGADKYKEYMLIDGEVACVGDTSVDLTDYAKKDEIPTELPANGGNADTVNTHTVASDVPENAVFTDTVYDDTKIKDDLSTLKYDNTHGGENLCSGLDFVNAITGTGLSTITVDRTQGTIRFTQNNSSNYKNNGFIISDSNYNFKENTQYSVILTGFSEDPTNLASSICIHYTDGSVDDTINLKGTIKDIISYTSKASKTIKCIKYEFTGQNYKVLYYNECGVFEGVVSENDFKPHIPSVKMLAEEKSQQSREIMDIKMLGWSVPKECPVQNEVNENQFIQKVGRVDLENQTWTSVDTNTSLYTTSIKDIITSSNNIFLLGYSVTSYDIETSKMTNKNIKMSGLDKQDFYIKNDSYTDVDLFKQAMRNQYLYYELANPVTITIDGNEIGETVGNVRKETTVNLLNPTLETTASNGVTLTANGDGTYTLNGTATSKVALSLGKVSLKANKSYKLIAQSPTNTSTDVKVLDFRGTCFGDGTYKGATPIITPARDYAGIRMVIEIAKTTTLNNFIIKPMITTNLDATYDDFVPYTGNTGGLNNDVAEIRNEVSQQSAKINSNTASLLKTIHEVYSMKIGNSAVDPVVISDFKIDPGYRYLYIINGSGTTGYEVGILMFINGMKFVPLSSSDSATAIKDSVSAIGINIYIEQGQLKVSRSATSYAVTCVIYKLG